MKAWRFPIRKWWVLVEIDLNPPYEFVGLGLSITWGKEMGLSVSLFLTALHLWVNISQREGV